jgi:hypothetical protein
MSRHSSNPKRYRNCAPLLQTACRKQCGFQQVGIIKFNDLKPPPNLRMFVYTQRRNANKAMEEEDNHLPMKKAKAEVVLYQLRVIF